MHGLFPAQYVLRRPTRGALAAHSRSFEMPRSRTVQFSRSFVLSCVRLLNGLHESVFAGEGVGAFKNFSQSLSFTRLTARCFFLFPFPGTQDSMGVFGLIGSLPLLMLFLVLNSLGVF